MVKTQSTSSKKTTKKITKVPVFYKKVKLLDKKIVNLEKQYHEKIKNVYDRCPVDIVKLYLDRSVKYKNVREKINEEISKLIKQKHKDLNDYKKKIKFTIKDEQRIEFD